MLGPKERLRHTYATLISIIVPTMSQSNALTLATDIALAIALVIALGLAPTNWDTLRPRAGPATSRPKNANRA